MFIYWCTVEFEDGYLYQFDILAESLDQAEALADIRISEEGLSYDGEITDVWVVKKETGR